MLDFADLSEFSPSLMSQASSSILSMVGFRLISSPCSPRFWSTAADLLLFLLDPASVGEGISDPISLFMPIRRLISSALTTCGTFMSFLSLPPVPCIDITALSETPRSICRGLTDTTSVHGSSWDDITFLSSSDTLTSSHCHASPSSHNHASSSAEIAQVLIVISSLSSSGQAAVVIPTKGWLDLHRDAPFRGWIHDKTGRRCALRCVAATLRCLSDIADGTTISAG
mmetsp:Transcript_16194/g.24402  ORF Transcript_16194/g.24402 Transcript_16194/m.24402 type:complete len:227 (-) Transcript_16194:1838-2518(-)